MVFEFENGERIAVSNSSQVEDLLDQLGEADRTFIILTAPNGHYLQAATSRQGHVIEKQLGDLSEHYRASQNGHYDRFTLKDVKLVARGFLKDQASNAGLDWEKFDPKQDADAINPDDLRYFVETYGNTRSTRSLWMIRRVETLLFPVLAVGLLLFVMFRVVQGFLGSP